MVHAVAPGKANIICTSVDNPEKTITCRLTVKEGSGNTSTPEPYVLGDVNADESINAADALLVLRHAAKIAVLDEAEQLAADVTKEGDINANDALLILKLAAKIIDKF